MVWKSVKRFLAGSFCAPPACVLRFLVNKGAGSSVSTTTVDEVELIRKFAILRSEGMKAGPLPSLFKYSYIYYFHFSVIVCKI